MPKSRAGMPNCIKIALLTHKKSIGLIQKISYQTFYDIFYKIAFVSRK